MKKHYITLPNGQPCALEVYLKAWRQLRQIRPDADVLGWDYFAEPAAKILRDMEAGSADRINRRIPGYGHGRKWSYEWQTETMRAARALNTPRLAIHWLPSWLKPRFAHRLSNFND